jgi:hypothetical protein
MTIEELWPSTKCFSNRYKYISILTRILLRSLNITNSIRLLSC